MDGSLRKRPKISSQRTVIVCGGGGTVRVVCAAVRVGVCVGRRRRRVSVTVRLECHALL